ncbi:tripartite tricarboxylate transporter TctB family protein [Microvirga calopogonii]|uniref:tripartite tricarboxylate transporter TctB family protein n=1 Tax=Microvirga calopogonii TaxID=2078013 RepID=UPI000E0E032F|nr:tripartite tricarboxylate transporter TctB family protein [Microvirga calopogonii]
MNERALISRTSMEVATALVTGIVGVAVMWGAVEHDIGWGDSGPASGYFPFRIGVLIVLASLTNLVFALWHRSADHSTFVTNVQMRSVLAFGLPILGFVVVSSFLGLYVGTILYLSLVMIFQGGYRPVYAIGLALAVAVAMRLIFPIWFKVPLLTGPLEALLGLY